MGRSEALGPAFLRSKQQGKGQAAGLISGSCLCFSQRLGKNGELESSEKLA